MCVCGWVSRCVGGCGTRLMYLAPPQGVGAVAKLLRECGHVVVKRLLGIHGLHTHAFVGQVWQGHLLRW